MASLKTKATAGAAVVALAVVSHPNGSFVPAGDSYTPTSWARAFLRSGGLPITTCNVRAVVGWENAEGGHWHNNAKHNPLNTTQPEPRSWPVNDKNVQAYPTWRAGLKASRTTLNNGLYGPVISAFRAGGDAQSVATAVTQSPWGTGQFQVTC